MRRLWVLAAWFLTAPVFGQAGVPLTGSFEGWRSKTIGDSAEGGTLHLEPVLGRDWIVHGGSGEAKEVTISATVIPVRPRGDQWKVGGIGVYASDDRFWHLAFVESPNSAGARHSIELSEMLDQKWNAQFSLPDHLDKGGANWVFGHPYHLTLNLRPTGISGEVTDGTTVIFQEVRDFSQGIDAVRQGRAALTDSSMALDYSAVEAAERDRVAAPKSTPPSYLPYPGTGVATVSSGRGARIPSAGAPSGHQGFFQTKQVNGKWWFLDPAGKPFLAVTTDHVNYNAHFCEALGYAPFHQNLERIYGGEPAWAKAAAARLKSWGFNSLAAGCNTSLRGRGLPYTEYLSFGTAFSDNAAIVPKTTWTGWPDVFDPRWPKFCKLVAEGTCVAEKDDPWLIGYTLDNELEWFGKGYEPWGIAVETWRLPKDRPAKVALVERLKSHYHGDIANLNVDFGTSFNGFDDVLESTKPPVPKNQSGRDALMNFVELASDRYFSAATAAIRSVDTNHLILGCRFAYDAPPPAVKAEGKYCDVLTVNIYPRVDLFSGVVFGLKEHIDGLVALAGRPAFVTEWGFPGLDAVDSRGLPLPSTVGAGMRVDTQAQRAICFRSMQTALFANPHVIGSSFFMYADEPALGISKTFAENSNYGLVSETDQPYQPVVQAATDVNRRVTAIHANLPVGQPKSRDWLTPNLAGDVSVRMQIDGKRYEVETSRLKLSKDSDSGEVFDSLSLKTDRGWENLGTYHPLVWLTDNGQSDWEAPGRLEDVQQIGANRLRLTLSGAKMRTTLELQFVGGVSYFLARVVSIQSTASAAVRLRAYFHYALWRADEFASVQPYQAVPDYWLPVGAWVSPSRALALGVIPQRTDAPFNVTFWKDQSLHSDFLRELNIELAPGEAWHAQPDEPWAAVFLTRVDGNGKLDLSKVIDVR